MSGASNRRRGHDAERHVVAYLKDHGFPDAVTTRNTGGAGGRQVGDVAFTPGVSLEVKDVAVRAWPSWLRQAAEQAEERIPVVVHRIRGVRDVGRWPCALPWDRWFDDLDGELVTRVFGAPAGDYDWLLNIHIAPVVAHRRKGAPLVAVMRFATFVDAVRSDR